MSAHRAQIHSHRDKKTRRPINALPDGCKTACHQTKCSWTNVQSEGLQSFSLPLSYRFFLVSFFFLHVWAALLEERAVAWPVVFRWSKSLFLVANSYWQITQRRLTSFYKEQKKKKKHWEKVALSFSTTNCWQTFQRAIMNSKLGLHNLR